MAGDCETVAIWYAEHVAPRSKSRYLFMLQQGFMLILKRIYPWGWGMFCQDICGCGNCLLKQFYNHHTNRGGGRGLTIQRQGRALTHVLECAFIYSNSRIVANDFARRGGCTNARLYEESDLTSDIIDDVMSANVIMKSS